MDVSNGKSNKISRKRSEPNLLNDGDRKRVRESKSDPSLAPNKKFKETNSQRKPAKTCIVPSKLPLVFDRVLQRCTEEERKLLDIYEVQNLIVTCALDMELFGKSAKLDDFIETIYQTVMEDKEEISVEISNYNSKSNGATYWSDQKHIALVLDRYNKYMNSEEMIKRRKYINKRYLWTCEDVTKFNEAMEMYHDTPDSHIDDLIANYISNGVGRKHVRYFRKFWMREEEKRLKGDLEEMENTVNDQVNNTENVHNICKEMIS